MAPRTALSTTRRRTRRRAHGRARLTQLCAAFVTLLAPAAVATPLAHAGVVRAPALTRGSLYLALGDSVTFGYQEADVVPRPDYTKQGTFLGYPEHLARELGVKVVNASCPGETSASFIDPSAPSNGCENAPNNAAAAYRKLFPLHTHYKGSQLAFAVSYLRRHRNVRLVSLMIGANDFFVCEETSPDHCLSPSEMDATLARVKANVHRILAAIRRRAGYRGQIVVVNYYSLNYGVGLENTVSRGLDSAQDSAAKPFRVEIAPSYSQFAAQARIFGGATCQAGLLTEWTTNGTPTCGVHPSYAGQALLAEAVLRAILL